MPTRKRFPTRLFSRTPRVVSAKLDVINRIESRLPIAPFVAEWMALMQKEYTSFTESEQRVPLVFVALYAATVIAGCLLAAGVIR